MRSPQLRLACGLYLLLGCRSSSFCFGYGTKLPAGEDLIRGRVVISRGGQPVVWEGGAFSREGMQVYVMPQAGGTPERYILRGDGSFCWHFRPGRYVIAGIEGQAGMRFSSGRIWAEFSVPASASQTCVGTLAIQFSGDRYTLNVVDDCDAIQAAKSGSYPTGTGAWRKELMVLEAFK